MVELTNRSRLVTLGLIIYYVRQIIPATIAGTVVYRMSAPRNEIIYTNNLFHKQSYSRPYPNTLNPIPVLFCRICTGRVISDLLHSNFMLHSANAQIIYVADLSAANWRI